MKENEEYIKSHINSLRGKQLLTLDQRKPFTVDGIKGSLIMITTSTNAPRNVPLQGTIDAYNHIIKRSVLTRAEIRENNYSDWNPAYIAAILANFLEVEHQTRPITLFLKIQE